MTLPSDPILLRWSERVRPKEVQDPLGLGARGSSRFSRQLLYCITSITPRARYFSFIPWCVLDYQMREKARPYAAGLRDAIILREQALTLACIANHDGEPCNGGGLVGSREAKRWFLKGNKQANFRKLKHFSKYPALNIYFSSLKNLGLFVTEQDLPDSDEEDETSITFDDLTLTPLGMDLAKRYDAMVGNLAATKQIVAKERSCQIQELTRFGRRGCLCALSQKASADRDLLRDIFFAIRNARDSESNRRRRQSLLLILTLCGQLEKKGWILDETSFAGATYFGKVANGTDSLVVKIPAQLDDIAKRWRMFYFHHFMSVALEGMFAWLVSNLCPHEQAGTTLELLVDQLDKAAVGKDLKKIIRLGLPTPFGSSSPADLFALVGLPKESNTDQEQTVDLAIKSRTPLSEDFMEELIRSKEYQDSPTGLALPMILLATTLRRYKRWEATSYGDWLARPVDAPDPYLDLTPPLVSNGLSDRFGNWIGTSWKDLARFVLSRYVIQQHIMMSYEKPATEERCIIQVDGKKIIASSSYEKIGMGNPRLGSAIQILVDLGLIEKDEDKSCRLTSEGKIFLSQELAKEAL